ncbi:MAG: hypothetical protein ACI8UD_001453, partial [Planctomycetota bacterium]
MKRFLTTVLATLASLACVSLTAQSVQLSDGR